MMSDADDTSCVVSTPSRICFSQLRSRLQLLFILLAGCPTPQLRPTLVRIDTVIPGLSGLTEGPDGDLWSVAERARAVIRIDRDTGEVKVFALEGVPEEAETEAIAYLGDGRFVLGTETEGSARAHDDILFAELDGDVVRVVERSHLPYEMWDLLGHHNHGIEGLCAVEGAIWLSAEIVGEMQGRRYAPIARRDGNGQWTIYRVWLSSDEGKLAALSCRHVDEGTELFAVERHFGVLRVLRVVVPFGAGEDLDAEVVLNLDEWVARDESPNLEGLVVIGDRMAMVADNHYRGRPHGDNTLYWFELR